MRVREGWTMKEDEEGRGETEGWEGREDRREGGIDCRKEAGRKAEVRVIEERREDSVRK